VKGTYSVAADCTGTGTIVNIKNATTTHFNLAVDATSGVVEFVGTDQGHGTASGSMTPQGTTACSAAALQGTFGFHGGGYVIGVGVEQLAGQIVLDGVGNMTGTSTDVIAGQVTSGSFTGKYTVAKNCTGTLTGTFSGQTSHWNLVVVDGGKGLEAIVADTSSVTTISVRQ
jgi:hypothetical protein